MDNTNRQAVKNWLDSQTTDASLTSWRQPFCKFKGRKWITPNLRDASLVCESSQFLTAWRLVLSMKPWSYIWLEFGLFSTIIAIIRACACWALFVVTLTNTVHLIHIYIYIYIYWSCWSNLVRVVSMCGIARVCHPQGFSCFLHTLSEWKNTRRKIDWHNFKDENWFK